MGNNLIKSGAKTSEQLTSSDNSKFTNGNINSGSGKYVDDFKILIEAEKNLDSKKKEIDEKLKKMEGDIDKIEDKVKREKSTLISIF
jgi:predicted nuclease with TOPRIM domain